MFKLLFLLGIVGVGAYFFPQVYEGTSNACTGIEAKVLRAAGDAAGDAQAALNLLARASNGEMARAAVAREYPNLPGGLACVVGYYDLDSDDLR